MKENERKKNVEADAKQIKWGKKIEKGYERGNIMPERGGRSKRYLNTCSSI